MDPVWEAAPAAGPPDRRNAPGLDLLRKAARSRANVLITGDLEGGRRFFRDEYEREAVRFLSGERLNREGAGLLFRPPPADGTILFLDRVESLERRVQGGLLDYLEGFPGPGAEALLPAKVVSTSGADLARRVSEGRFDHSLYLRLATLSVHLRSVEACASAGVRPRSGRMLLGSCGFRI